MAKKSKRKQYPIKFDSIDLWDRLVLRASDDMRSVNKTILLAIEKYLAS